MSSFDVGPITRALLEDPRVEPVPPVRVTWKDHDPSITHVVAGYSDQEYGLVTGCDIPNIVNTYGDKAGLCDGEYVACAPETPITCLECLAYVTEREIW